MLRMIIKLASMEIIIIIIKKNGVGRQVDRYIEPYIHVPTLIVLLFLAYWSRN